MKVYLSLYPLHRIGLLLLLLLLPAVARGTIREHAQIQGPFASVQDVTRNCLGCHQSEGMDMLHSSHWTWERERIPGEDTSKYAKSTGLTYFAIQPQANPAVCGRCHVRINAETKENEAADPSQIDCLVCHDTTGRHQHMAASVPTAAELLQLARKVGRPTASNCFQCHRSHCLEADRQQAGPPIEDVHLQQGKAAMRCQSCHLQKGRHVLVRLPDSATAGQGPSRGCVACHTGQPHSLEELNRHGELISCQTCHIPSYGTSAPALLSWNWMAGRHSFSLWQTGTKGQAVPLVQAGGFTMASNVIPVYRWDDGTDRLYKRGDRTTPGKITLLQAPARRTIHSQIRPFQVIYGTQLYDARYRYLISPRLASDPTVIIDTTDWNLVARQGMEGIRLPYSGQYGVTTTVTYKRLNHGVVPASQALGCLDCHGASARIPWKELGYARDPWMETARQPAANTGQPVPPPDSQVIEEIILTPEKSR